VLACSSYHSSVVKVLFEQAGTISQFRLLVKSSRRAQKTDAPNSHVGQGMSHQRALAFRPVQFSDLFATGERDPLHFNDAILAHFLFLVKSAKPQITPSASKRPAPLDMVPYPGRHPHHMVQASQKRSSEKIPRIKSPAKRECAISQCQSPAPSNAHYSTEMCD